MANLPYHRARRSLAFKLSSAVALVILLVVGLMSVFATLQERSNAVRHELVELQTVSKELAARIDLSLASGQELAAHLACTRDVTDFLGPAGDRESGRQAFQAWLDLQLQQTPGISSIFILSPMGVCLASTNRVFLGRNYSFRPYFQEAASGRTGVSDWSIGLVARLPHIDSSAPVRIDGHIAGVLVTEFPVDQVERAIRATGVNGRTAVLINRFGIALSHSDPARQYHSLLPLDAPVLAQLELTRQFMGRAIVADPLSQDFAMAFRRAQASAAQQTASYRLGTSAKLAVLTPLAERDWVVSVALPQEELFRPIHKIMAKALLVGLATALVGILAAFAMMRSLLGSIHRLSGVMDRFGAGELAARAPVTGEDERGQLAQTFNAMADALQAHQERLEELIRARTQALSQSERYHRELTQAVPVGIFRLDVEGVYRFANDHWFEITGLRDLQGAQRRFEDQVHADDRGTALLKLRQVFLAREPADLECRLVRPDGRTVWVIARIVPQLDDARRVVGFIGTLLNISQRKEAEETQRGLEIQLHEAHKMESLGVLAAGVAHNLNNVLAIIMGTASLRGQEAVAVPDRDAYQSISKACARGRDVVKSMLQFAKPHLAIKAPFEVHGLIREVRVLLANTTGNAVVITEAFAGEPLWILGDSAAINHVILNLCLNALGAMPNGGTLVLRTAILDGDWLEIAVEDNGAGMTAEVLAHVLEPFYTTKEVGKGTGLGLSMTYGVVKAHGGTIALSSQPGHGTTARLRFPRIPAPPAAPEPAPVPGPDLRAMAVFMVDDDEDVRFLMTRMLKRAGARQVETFASGQEVLEALQGNAPPDLIILDQNMPGLNGTQTLERIRALHPQVPVLISSGQPDIEGWECFRQPRVGVISKPFSIDEIQARLAQFARTWEAGPEQLLLPS